MQGLPHVFSSASMACAVKLSRFFHSMYAVRGPCSLLHCDIAKAPQWKWSCSKAKASVGGACTSSQEQKSIQLQGYLESSKSCVVRCCQNMLFPQIRYFQPCTIALASYLPRVRVLRNTKRGLVLLIMDLLLMLGAKFQYDQELGEAIEIEYLRFVPFMNKALARLVQEEHPQYINDSEDQVKTNKSVFTACNGGSKHHSAS